MNPIELIIKGLMEAATEAVEDERLVRAKIRLAREEVARLESALVGAVEKRRQAEEILRVTTSRAPIRHCSSREVELLRSCGIAVKVGDIVSPFLKNELVKLGMSHGC